MANILSPYGFARVDKVGGKDKQFTFKFPLQCNATGSSTLSSSLAAGDAVAFGAVSGGAGQIQPLIPYSGTSAPVPAQIPLGIFVGVKYTDLQGNLINSQLWVANTQVKPGTVPVAIIDCDPQSVYAVQLSGPITAAQTNSVYSAAGLNACMLSNSAGPNVNIKSSIMSLNVASLALASGASNATSNYYQFKILGLANMPSTDPNNSWQDQYPNVVGVFNNHVLKAGTLSVSN